MRWDTGKTLSKRLACFALLITALFSVSNAESGFTDNADAVEAAAKSVFMLEVYSSSKNQIAVGSGFVAFDSNLLVTNYHVIEGGSYILAISDDHERHLIREVCCTDSKKDIAILRFEDDSHSAPLPLETENNLKRAQKVVAIGSPAGLMNTISLGNISAFYSRDGRDWIQFTAPISSGSSGGALINDEGKVIGVTTATYASAQNVNMAVRIRDVIELYDRWNKRTVSSLGTGISDAAAYAVTANTSENSGRVWVSASGKKYHNNPSCSKMRSPVEMDLLDAIEKGFTPCGKCYK